MLNVIDRKSNRIKINLILCYFCSNDQDCTMLLVSAVRYTVETARDQTLLISTNFVITLNQIEFITTTLDKCNFSFNMIKLIEIDFQYILKMDLLCIQQPAIFIKCLHA